MANILDSLVYGNSKDGIPAMVEEAYNRKLKQFGKKLWSGIIKASASGFGKGVLLTAAVLLGGFALASGLGAVAAGGLLAEGMAVGLSQAGNFMLGALAGTSWFGPALLLAGGTLGAVSDVRKHTNNLTAEMARVEAENFNITREANLVKELQGLQAAQEKSAYLQPASKNNEPSFSAREMLRREASSIRTNRGI